MENKLQIDSSSHIGASSSLLTRSLQMVNGRQETNQWWMTQTSSPPSSQYLAVPQLEPFTFSSVPCYTNPLQDGVYTSSYRWENTYNAYPPASHEDGSSPAYTDPPAYPYPSYAPATLPCNYYPNSLSPMDESIPSSPESQDTLHDNSNNSCSYGSQSSLTLSSQPESTTCTVPNVLPSCTSFAPMGYPAPVAMLDTQSVQAEPKILKKQVRMPQRKGGIQLWQFMYSLLSDSKYSNIIEWTSNRLSNEFRMLEPESIAVWWGTIKSKPTMTYDKFSRSLRYYYHKGILKKIPGERYMYRFLVDPEDMYRHIGASDKRPELKSMPKEAKLAMGMFQKQSKSAEVVSDRLAIVTKPPESLQPATRSTPSPHFDRPTSINSNTIIVDSFGSDFNNSNNSSNDMPFSFTRSQPIPIAAGAW